MIVAEVHVGFIVFEIYECKKLSKAHKNFKFFSAELDMIDSLVNAINFDKTEKEVPKL